MTWVVYNRGMSSLALTPRSRKTTHLQQPHVKQSTIAAKKFVMPIFQPFSVIGLSISEGDFALTSNQALQARTDRANYAFEGTSNTGANDTESQVGTSVV